VVDTRGQRGTCASMESSSAAGYVDAGSALRQRLRRLGALRPPVPVLSLYLDLDPSQFATGRARGSAVTSLLDEAHKRVEEAEADHDGKVSLRADIERATEFFEGFEPKGARGVAIFSASAAGVFETFTLPRPTQTEVVIDDSPYVTPLAAAADTRDWLIVLVDTRHARFLHGNTDHVEELEQVEDTVLGQHERQGPSDHQRRVEHEVDQHLARAARLLDERLRDGGFERVLVGGPPEIAPRFEEAMSNPAREKLAGRFEVELPDVHPDDVRHAAIPCFVEDERRHERELLDRLAERLGRGERAAGGYEAVRAALEMAAVETLLYDERWRPADAGTLERAIEDAVQQSAEVLPVRHHLDALEPHGHVAALLRFAVRAP
jgi:peptide chain release factor subunit 1